MVGGGIWNVIHVNFVLNDISSAYPIFEFYCHFSLISVKLNLNERAFVAAVCRLYANVEKRNSSHIFRALIEFINMELNGKLECQTESR